MKLYFISDSSLYMIGVNRAFTKLTISRNQIAANDIPIIGLFSYVSFGISVRGVEFVCNMKERNNSGGCKK